MATSEINNVIASLKSARVPLEVMNIARNSATFSEL